MSKRILITGAAGFIGSHLCKTLLELNNEVLCIDNFYSGSKENIKKLMDYEKFQFIKHDIISSLSLEVDEIYNLAAQSHVAVSFQIPEYTTDVNALGCLRILEIIRQSKKKIKKPKVKKSILRHCRNNCSFSCNSMVFP